MIQEHDEYQIYFTRDDIRSAAGHLASDKDGRRWVPAELTDEQCDAIAEEVAGLFEDEFRKNVRNVEV